EDWSRWYQNEKGWPSPNPPHHTPKSSEEEQKAFNEIWRMYGDIGMDGTFAGVAGVDPDIMQQRFFNYFVIVSCESKVPLDILVATAYQESKLFHFYTEKCIELYTRWGLSVGNLGDPVSGGGVDWGIMQVNYPSWGKQYSFEKFGDWQKNWHTNIRIGSMIARDAIDRIPGKFTTDNGQKAYYSCYNTSSHEAFEVKGSDAEAGAEGFLINLIRIQEGKNGDFDLEFEFALQETAKLIKPILDPDNHPDNDLLSFR
ncbi:MAG: hypothetical protein LBB49_05440, partial [Gracilibacteraceae bacterium]|nr:hypothetical protein [Gracilibacteraceae bacterium]